MKKTMSLLLVLAMVLSLFAGCGGETAVETPAAVETPVVEESLEIQQLLQEDWIPETIRENLDETILWNEMLYMLTNVITLCDASGLESWNAVVSSIDDEMERDDGMLAIYEAACSLGIGHQARGNWLEYNSYYDTNKIWHTNFSPDENMFS